MLAGQQKLEGLVSAAYEAISEQTEDAVVGVAMLVLEVKEKGLDSTAFFVYSTDRRQWVQRALLAEASDVLVVYSHGADEDD